MILQNPKNQTAEVLYMLLKEDFITFKFSFEMSGMINLSARISNLRLDHELDIPCLQIKTRNKFGRPIRYGSWKLEDKEKGLEVYNKINTDK